MPKGAPDASPPPAASAASIRTQASQPKAKPAATASMAERPALRRPLASPSQAA